MIVILDGNNALMRAWSETPQLTLKDGTPCGGAWGLCRSLLAAVTSLRHRADHRGGSFGLVIAWDSGTRSPRREALLPSYKSGRGNWTPEEIERRKVEIRLQQRLVDRVLGHVGAISLQADGVEADDLIAYAAGRLPGSIILSADKDFLQLRAEQYEPSVRLRGVVGRTHARTPDEIVWVKCLSGDPSDAIPGVGNIGLKRARLALEAYHATTYTSPWEWGDAVATGAASLPAFVRSANAKAIRRGLQQAEIIERNRQLMDLRISREWPEVREAVLAAPDPLPISARGFEGEIMRLGWGGLANYLRLAQQLEVGDK